MVFSCTRKYLTSQGGSQGGISSWDSMLDDVNVEAVVLKSIFDVLRHENQRKNRKFKRVPKGPLSGANKWRIIKAPKNRKIEDTNPK